MENFRKRQRPASLGETLSEGTAIDIDREELVHQQELMVQTDQIANACKHGLVQLIQNFNRDEQRPYLKFYWRSYCEHLHFRDNNDSDVNADFRHDPNQIELKDLLQFMTWLVENGEHLKLFSTVIEESLRIHDGDLRVTSLQYAKQIEVFLSDSFFQKHNPITRKNPLPFQHLIIDPFSNEIMDKGVYDLLCTQDVQLLNQVDSNGKSVKTPCSNCLTHPIRKSAPASATATCYQCLGGICNTWSDTMKNHKGGQGGYTCLFNCAKGNEWTTENVYFTLCLVCVKIGSDPKRYQNFSDLPTHVSDDEEPIRGPPVLGQAIFLKIQRKPVHLPLLRNVNELMDESTKYPCHACFTQRTTHLFRPANFLISK